MSATIKDSAERALAREAERMAFAAQDTVEAVRRPAEKLTGRVRDRPLTSIVIAAATGYVIGRLAY